MKKKETEVQMSYELNNNELILTESRSMRDELVFKDEVLEKVKVIPRLSSSVEITIEMAATYYGVPAKTIESTITRNRSEFNEYNEVRVLKGSSLSEFKTLLHDEGAFKGINSLTLITRRGLLRLGMILTQSEVAKTIRNYLLNVEEVSTIEQKNWAIEREISKRERRRLTDAIKDFYEGSLKGKGYEYPTFTNLVYKVLWDTNAEGLKRMYGLEKADTLRDALSTDDLRKVVDVETAISTLIKIDKDYDEIKEQLLKSKKNFR